MCQWKFIQHIYNAFLGAREEIIWLSHCNFGCHQLEVSNEMHVIIYSKKIDKFPVARLCLFKKLDYLYNLILLSISYPLISLKMTFSCTIRSFMRAM